MQALEIEIEARELLGTRASRRTRREGFVPCVVYARGQEPFVSRIPEKEFVLMALAARSSQLFAFKSSHPDLNGATAVVKQIQRNHLDGKVVHVDFQRIRENEEISVLVVLKFIGEAPGVKLDGGILTTARHDIALRTLPKNIPNEIQVDVSGLGMGQSIHAHQLNLPQGVKLSGNPEETIVSVVAVRQVAVEEPTAAATAEGAAAAPAEGAAAAAGAAAPAEGAAKGGDKKAADKK